MSEELKDRVNKLASVWAEVKRINERKLNAPPTFTQEDVEKAATAIVKMNGKEFREGSKLKLAMLGEDMTPIALAALNAVGKIEE